MIRHWCEMMGHREPGLHRSGRSQARRPVAPAAMLQAWCLEARASSTTTRRDRPPRTLRGAQADRGAGYPSVVAVNSDLEFELSCSSRAHLLLDAAPSRSATRRPPRWAMGFFVTLMMSTSEQPGATRRSGEQLFRVFKFKPAHAVKPSAEAQERGAAKIKASGPGHQRRHALLLGRRARRAAC